MKPALRKARKSDLPILEHIEYTCFSPARRSSRRALLLSLRSPSQSVWLAELDTGDRPEVVGGMILHTHRRTLRIFSLAVLPSSQNMGIGHCLLEQARDLALAGGQTRLSLEAEEHNTELIQWYQRHGFCITQHLSDYYGAGWHALRMHCDLEANACGDDPTSFTLGARNLIVMNNPAHWKLDIPSVELVAARDYLSDPRYQNLRNVRVFNLCRSYRYQSVGYYVSLLAAARDHRPIPCVTTIQDVRCQTIVQSITWDIDDLIQKSLAGQAGQRESVLHIYFGQTLDPAFSRLGRELYRLFEAPLIRVHFAFAKKWFVQQIVPLAMKSVPAEDLSRLPELARAYFSQKPSQATQLRQYAYDLAILVDPLEKSPPSCPRALRNFRKAAEKGNMSVEFITREDFGRLCEFDALFIRETTAVEHHTYRFSRKAYAEGLVVIDDPWSILRCANKVYLNERLVQAQLPAPRTWVIQKDLLRRESLADVPLPLVLKQPDGAFSRGVVKVHTEAELRQELTGLFATSDLLIAQEFIRSEFDWRIGVLDRAPLFACKYFMARGHWQIYNWNGARGALTGRSQTLSLDQVPPAVLDTAVRAADQIGDGLYGVDLKQVEDQVYVIEVNDNPNIDAGIEDAVLKDEIYRRIMQSFLRRIEVARSLSSVPVVQPLCSVVRRTG